MEEIEGDAERRFHEESLAGHREKLTADVREAIGPRLFDGVVVVADAVQLVVQVVRHPIASGRAFWALAWSPELRAQVLGRSRR